MTRVTSGSPESAERGLIHEAVSQPALRHPERTALRQGDVKVTYRELHLASEELAVDLHAAGVGPGAMEGWGPLLIGGERVSQHHVRQFLTHQDHRVDRDVELLAGDRSGL
ncbi:hypothetical protein ADK52_17495 [Streptomyces sp. WM6372]|uniref:hypothetical protein n=1 Tax=Streptomyces sp. WM6372 TaxID=1415555 RepID=UPI0006C5DCEC|nr:hypothetical protein [Streptomyces sp. WM6372]KOU23522.1 hypothetical protein ADK52_17495 [Streptomyces sp. WM6372]